MRRRHSGCRCRAAASDLHWGCRPYELRGSPVSHRRDDVSAPGVAGRGSAAVRLAGIGLLAAGVTASLYVAGRLNTPDYAFGLFGQAGLGAIALKSMLASCTLGLAVLQVLLALWIYRKLPLAGSPPRPVRLTHKIIGFGLFALTVPIAVHCLLAYGVQLTSLRVAVHSLAGCFFYGAFAAKVLLVRTRRLPGWALPVAGGMLAVVVAVLWYTSALWYYDGFQLPAL
jgi:hypothetical protein